MQQAELEGFLRLADIRNNTRNHAMRTLRFAIFSCMRAQTVRQLVRITWENLSLVHITAGWLFDGDNMTRLKTSKQSPASFTRCS